MSWYAMVGKAPATLACPYGFQARCPQVQRFKVEAPQGCYSRSGWHPATRELTDAVVRRRFFRDSSARGGDILANAAARLDGWAKANWAVIGIVLIAVVAELDILTGYELSFSLFYLLPIALVAWYGGRRAALAACILSAAAWLLAEVIAGQRYSQPLIFVWNAAMRFGFFVIVAWLLTTLKRELERERQLSRSDYLTGAASPGFFYDLLKLEIDRCTRNQRPFTLAYIDLDNFKSINDQFGHSTGDQLLREVVACARQRLRKTDIVARLGGDELAVLLPETNQQGAPVVISSLQEALLSEMSLHNWPVTFSIGAMTFPAAPATPNEVIGMVDALMYTVKNSGKNSIRYSVYAG
jgi:diguanylate cyclase (GGDEF)-like protein